MRARLGTLSCVLLLLAAPAARAEEPEGRRHAPTAEDERLGRAVAERLQVELEGVDRVTLHATRGPLPAGTVLTANVEQATLREVTVAAVTLPDGRAAAAYAANVPAGDDQLVLRAGGGLVVVFKGPGASAAQARLLAQGAGDARALDEVLGALGEAALERERKTVQLEVPLGPELASGPQLRLPGVRAALLSVGSAHAAAVLAGELEPRAARRVVDQRGARLIVLQGDPLENAARAARLVAACWDELGEQSARENLLTLAPAGDGDALRAFAAMALQPGGPFYEVGANALRLARQRGEEDIEGFRYKFLDGELRNHVLFRAPELQGEALVTVRRMLVIVAPTQAEYEHEKAHLLDLARALRIGPPRPSPGTIELPETE